MRQILILISLICIFGTAVYHLYMLNAIGVFVGLVLTISIFSILNFWERAHIKKIQKHQNLKLSLKIKSSQKIKIYNFFASFLYLALFSVCLSILFSSQTDKAIISPWQEIPFFFFALYALLTIILIISIFQKHRIFLLFLSLHYFLSFSIALIIYKIGFGFDQFIHTATMEVINKAGEIHPKPFYYIGQYALIITIHKLTLIPITFLNKILIPLFASIFIPIFTYKTLKKIFNEKIKNRFVLLSLLLIPCSFAIVSTPQNLAYLFLILIILFGLTCASPYELTIVYILTLAIITIHPIAGIPAFFFVLLLTIYHSNLKQLKNNLYRIILILNTVSLPIAFRFINNNSPVEETISKKISLLNYLPQIPEKENVILNFIYLYGFNLKFVFILIALMGIAITIKYKKECRIFFIYLFFSISLFLSFILTNHLSFNFLIDYEQSNYTNRVLLISALFLFPFIVTAFFNLFEKILKQNIFIRASLFLFFVVMFPVSLYLTYPRLDNYFNSHSYSIGASDVDVVRWIDENAEGDYIVLANQQVSAAALREFGFKKYYKGDIFYYPIPTGAPLYKYFLKMVYEKPARATIEAAMDLTETREAYFVLNKYWWAFPKILEEAKIEADFTQEFDNGNVYVFKYNK